MSATRNHCMKPSTAKLQCVEKLVPRKNSAIEASFTSVFYLAKMRQALCWMMRFLNSVLWSVPVCCVLMWDFHLFSVINKPFVG